VTPIEVTDETFSGFVKNSFCVLSFTSPWCSACKKMHPVVESMAQEFDGSVSFGIMDISTSTQVPVELRILSLPTALIFVNGRETKRFTGAYSVGDLKTSLLELL